MNRSKIENSSLIKNIIKTLAFRITHVVVMDSHARTQRSKHILNHGDDNIFIRYVHMYSDNKSRLIFDDCKGQTFCKC